MGWDAYSSAKVDYRKNEIVDLKLQMLFKNAETDVKSKAVYVDGILYKGGLDCSECRDMLQKATNESVYEDWSEEKVREVAAKSNWDFEFEFENAWAYWSARTFLEICSNNNLSISFSY